MNKTLLTCLLLISAFTALVLYQHHKPVKNKKEDGPQPNDYFFQQRAFPYDNVPSDAYYAAVEWAQNLAVQRSGPVWELAGPANIGGRITDIAMHTSDLNTIYTASASGGVWKSVDAGENWLPITDGLPSLSIGDIAIDPSDKKILYCGTGETNGGGGSVTYDGAGVFKSTDGGTSWAALGLENTGSIGRIEVDPRNSKRIFVATMGRLFANNPERGLYRSDDGGLSWSKKLFINDSTGVIDLAINPAQPDTLFAVTWERVRRLSTRKYGGPGCGIYRSTDGGDSWTKLAGGLPQSGLGRMGISIAASSPNILYATIASESGAFLNTYKSADHGNTWIPMPAQSNPGYSSYGWWFGQIRAHPTDPNRIYNLGINWVTTANGGNSWVSIGTSLHVDHHALYIHPADPLFMVEGNDGGVYTSKDGGISWSFHAFPIAQFYTSEIDFQNPQRLYGGTQDNGTWRTGVQDPSIWEHIWGGDGFVTLVNPNNSAAWYAEYQYGGFSGANGAGPPLFARANWNAPYVFDPGNPGIMYFGGERLFKSVTAGLNWTPVSGDLSNGQLGMNGIVFGTITAIAVSPVDGNVIWAGTDDGNVWHTANGGTNWTKVSTNLPRRWISRLVADLVDPSTAYVCLSGFRQFDDLAHVYKTTDKGQNWTSVSGNLPDIPVNDLILDPLASGSLIVATDVGVFISENAGLSWSALGAGLPNVPMLDLTFHEPTRTLVVASYGRSMYRTNLPFPVGTENPGHPASFELYPNPVSDKLMVRLKGSTSRTGALRVWDISGSLVFSEKWPSPAEFLEIDTRAWSSGVYLVEIAGKSRKVVKP